MSVVLQNWTYRLDSGSLHHLLNLLEAEDPHGGIFTLLQRFLLLALQVVAYSLPTLIAGWAAGLLARQGWMESIGTWLPTLIVPLLFALPPLLVLNAPLILKAWRQFRLARELQPLKHLDDFWEARRQSGTWTQRRLRQRWLRRFTKILVTVPPAILLVLALHFASQAAHVPVVERLWVYFVCFTLPITVYWLSDLLARLRTRLSYFREVRQLRSYLASRAEDADDPIVDLPSEMASRLASVESASMLQRHALAILSDRTRSKGNYAVSKSQEAFSAIAALDREERRSVEETIDQLAREPGRGELLRVPGTDFELGYSVDREARRIHVMSLRRGSRD